MINILIRTSNRPMCFNRCIASIENQTYKDYRIIVSSDNKYDTYCQKYNPVKVKRIERLEPIGTIQPFPANSYLNSLLSEVNEGYVMFLDDDDILTKPDTLKIIINQAHEDSLVLWKVKVTGLGRTVPKFINVEPRRKDISMIGFCFHSKFKPLIHVAPYKQADFRLAQMLYSITKPIWINDVLTSTQGKEGFGKRKDY